MQSFDGWLASFTKHLQQLEPDLSGRFAWAIGVRRYDESVNPEAAARQVHEDRFRAHKRVGREPIR